MIVPHADLKFAHRTITVFVDAVALARAIHALEKPPYYLTVAQGSAFDSAVVSWCILFGSDHADNQKLHWKNMFAEEAFRAGLIEAVGKTFDEWRAYRKLVVDYRNELVAHRDLNPKTRFNPNFDTALLAAAYYHARLGERFENEVGARFVGGTFFEEFERRLATFSEDVADAVP